MERLTVFTPAYNRSDLLERCYRSLQAQSCKDFLWLIVDDGSTDDTGEKVAAWMESEKAFRIQYVYKENGGLHTGYNAAIERLETELAVCIDSDDYMPPKAVELILNYWDAHGSNQCAGIVGLDYTPDGQCIGDPLPDLFAVNLIDMGLGKYNIRRGDRKLVVRSELYKSVAPMKVFPGEKNFNPNYMHMEISRNYDFLVLNEELCTVEYQPTGMSNSMLRQYYNSPQSFAELRKQHLSYEGISLKYKFKEYVHYVSCCCLAKKWCGLKNINWLLFAAACPFGLALSLYVRYKNRG